MNLCYIQARAGSKRFPNKNIALWNGKPMVADAIEKAKATGLFDIIAVSSDSPIILDIARQYQVLPLWRSAEASSDTATDDDVAREVLSYFPDADIVCKLYPCVPLLDPISIVDAACYVGESGIYACSFGNIDAGAFYIFKRSAFYYLGTINLKDFPWKRYYIVEKYIQDINTPKDLEIAKRKAGM